MNYSQQASFNHLMSLAQRSHKNGDLEMAVNLYREALKVIKDQPDALHMMGIALSSMGKEEKAIECLVKAVRIAPQNPVFLVNLSEAYLKSKRYREAGDAAQKAVIMKPDFAEGYHKQGNAFKGLGNFEEAIRLYTKTLELTPAHFLALFNLGNIMLEMGNYSSAIRYYQQSIFINPNYPFAHNNLGIALQEWERLDEALMHYGKALQLKPDMKEALRNAAMVYEKQGRPKEAQSFYQELIRMDPDNKALQLQITLSSEIIYSSNAEIDQYRSVLKNLLDSFQTDDFTGMKELVDQGGHPPSELIYHGRDDKAFKEYYASLFSKVKRAEVNHKNERPHIGFVVTSGHEGVFIKCMRGILNHLNHQEFDISILCSLPNGEKILRPAIQNPGVKFISLSKDYNQALESVVNAHIDILYYWEIGTDAVNYFLALCKPAKIQVTSWGWPTTSGMKEVDYFISCRNLETDEGQNYYTEKLVTFERLPVYYYHPPVPVYRKPLSNYGLPEGANLYLCQQNLRKVHPDFDQVIKGILEKDSKGMVVFIEDKQQAITEKLSSRIKMAAGQSADRIVFVKRMEEEDYLSLLAQCAVALDTLHYGGGANTIYDAFEAGVPVVTMPSKMHKGRYAFAAYQQMGIQECIAKSVEEYSDLAVRIANNPEFRNSIVLQLKNKQQEIFEDVKSVKELEKFLKTIFDGM